MALGLGPSTSAQAQTRGYVLDGAAWMRMSPEERAAYAQGLNDSANFPFVNDDLEAAVVKSGRHRCLLEYRISPANLANIITNAYTSNPQQQGEPPLFVYVVHLANFCRDIINEERVRLGLPAQ
jgi:hypothetical protein